jgi:MFS transporter, FHS family, glucose/mannose:H+ symporter
LNKRWKIGPYFVLTAIFFGIFLFGIHENSRGIVLAQVRDERGLVFSSAGLLFAASPLAFVFSAAFFGRLLGSISFGKSWAMSLLFLVPGLFLFLFQEHFFLGIFSQISIGIGLGALQVIVNSYIVYAFPLQKARFLSLGAIFFSLGALSVSFFSALTDVVWQNFYVLMLFISILYGSGLLFIRRKFRPVFVSSRIELKIESNRKKKTIFIGMMFLYSMIEVGIGAWLLSYLYSFLAPNESQKYYALFLIVTVIGRLLAVFYLDKFPIRTLLLIHLGLLFPSYLLLISQSQLILGVIGSAWGLSIFFPGISAWIAAEYPQSSSKMLGLAYSISGFGGALALYGIALCSDVFSLRVGMAFVIPVMLFLGAILVLIKGRVNA